PDRDDQSNRHGRARAPQHCHAGALDHRTGEFGAWLAGGGKRHLAPSWIGISDAVRGGWDSADGQPLARVCAGDGRGRRLLDHDSDSEFPGRVWKKTGRRCGGEHGARHARGTPRKSSRVRGKLWDRGRLLHEPIWLGQEYAWSKRVGQHDGAISRSAGAGEFHQQWTTADISARYERDFTDRDRLGLIVLHEQARFEVPNENLQE